MVMGPLLDAAVGAAGVRVIAGEHPLTAARLHEATGAAEDLVHEQGAGSLHDFTRTTSRNEDGSIAYRSGMDETQCARSDAHRAA